MNVINFPKSNPEWKEEIIESLKQALALAEAGDVAGLFLVCDDNKNQYSAWLYAPKSLLAWCASYAMAKFTLILE